MEFLINSFTAHRFLITAATVASKVISDSFLRLAVYAQIGGVRATELRCLVRMFLCYSDWQIIPHTETILAYFEGVIGRFQE